MSDLPRGWEWTTIGEVTKTSLGKMLDKKQATGMHPTPYLRNINVRWGSFDLSDLAEMDIRPDELDRVLAQPGDVIVCEGGEPGRAAVWTGPGRIALQKALHRIQPSEAIAPGYLAHLLRHLAVSRQLEPFFTGTTIKHLPQEKLRLVPLPLPPIAEQERIVAAIEEHLSRLDAAAAALTQARSRLASLRSRFIGCLVDVLTTPELDEDAHAVPLAPGWSWMRASEVCEMVSSGSTPEAADMFSDAGDVPFIKVYNLQFDGDLDFTIKPTFVTRATHEGRLRRSRLMPGDVLINIVGPPLGKVSVVPHDHPEWNMNQAVAAFRPRPQLRRDFLRYLLMARSVVEPLLRTGKATAGQINLNISACRRLWLPVPPLAEQASLVRRLDAASSTWKDTVDQTAAASARGYALRRSILAAAFAGQLVSQD